MLSKALALRLPAVVVINKVDRHDARADEVLDEVYELFLDLATDADDIDFPVISAVAREARAMEGIGHAPAPTPTSRPCSRPSSTPSPPPKGDPEGPLQAIVTNLDASDYLGRLAIGRVVRGTLRKDTPIALLDEEVAEGDPPVTRKPSSAHGLRRHRPDRRRRPQRRRPLRAGRLPRGGDRRHLRRSVHPRGRSPA